MYNWNDYHNIFNMYEQVAYRRLICSNKVELQKKFMNFVKGAVGGNYSMGVMKMFKFKSHSK